MLVTLAGANVPLSGGEGEPSPEIICAAYARISRSPLPVHTLRAKATRDLPGARSFTERIVHHMGHESVAEHAVFNLDLLGVSRLVTEIVEHSRLASYTERSQRYVRIGGDYLIPQEARDLGLSRAFRTLVREQHGVYQAISARMARVGNVRAAREDARYALGLATTTQLGLTVNARALAAMLRRLEADPLHESGAVGRRIRKVVSRVAPSLIAPEGTSSPAESDPFLSAGRPWSDTAASSVPALLWHTPDPEHTLRRALDFCGEGSWSGSKAPAGAALGLAAPLPRAFEAVQLAFQLVVSSSAFAQLKRHRMATILTQPYDPSLGLTIPPTVEAAGMAPDLAALAEKSEELSVKVATTHPAAAAYLLLNAHRRRVVLILNARAFHQMAVLRLERHAQWDIRRQVSLMTSLLWDTLPSLAHSMGLPEMTAEPV
jgi:thymidylate synthase ThyX